MKMQFVDIVVGKQVYITFHFIHSDPRPRHVEHHPPIAEPRLVLDPDAGDAGSRGDPPAGVDFGRQQPEQLLQSVENPAAGGTSDLDVVGRDVEGVSLRRLPVRGVERQHDGAFPRHAVADPAPEVFGGVFGQGGQFAVGGDCRSGTEREDPFAGRRLFRGGLRRGGAQAAKGCRQEDQKS